MVQKEGSPIEGIVDINTFNYYVVGWISQVIDDSRQREFLKTEIPPYDREAEISQEEDKWGFANLPDLRSPLIFIRDCTWEETPNSLRKILTSQFGSLTQEACKQIDIRISRDRISFPIKSEFITRHREEIIGGTMGGVPSTRGGPKLFLGINNEYNGIWYVIKQDGLNDSLVTLPELPPSLGIKMITGAELIEEEATLAKQYNNKLSEVLAKNSVEIPASLEQLQDIARLLEKNKGRAHSIHEED